MTVLILGGAGFVGLNIAERLLAEGRTVLLFDRAPPPGAARAAFAALPGRLDAVQGDVTDAAAIRDLVRPGIDSIVLGAAITAGAERDAREPSAILGVNLMAQIPVLERARDFGVRRVINLSSAAAYGRAGEREAILREEVPADPVGLYAVSKLASERVVARLADLWGLDAVSVRLSAVFGPWERATGVRDTLSPQLQVMMRAAAGEPAVLERPGRRDWIYAPDVAEALARLLAAGPLPHRLYNVSAPQTWSVLDWGRALAQSMPGSTCRLAEPGEAATVSLHGSIDRAPLDTARLASDLGWSARFGCDDSAAHFAARRATVGTESALTAE